MSEKLPAPFTPIDCDLRQFDGFLMNVERLLSSELWALSTPEEFKCAMALWCRAWKQVPCASLPDDDAILAAFSGAGRRWPKVKKMALRGFVKCSDGRLYHTTLSADAMRAMKVKSDNASRTQKATEARSKKQRDDKRDVDRDDKRDVDRDDPENGNVTRSQYKEKKRIEVSSIGLGSSSAGATPLDRLAKLLGLTEKTLHRRPKFQDFPSIYFDWCAVGCDPEADIWPTIAKLGARSKDISSPKFFESAILEARDRRIASQPSPLEQWRTRVASFKKSQHWFDGWGAPPGHAECSAPHHVLVEFGFRNEDQVA